MKRWSSSGFHLQHYYQLMSLTQIHQYKEDFAGAKRVLDEATPAMEASMLLRFQVLRVFWWAMRGRTLAALAAQTSGADQKRLLREAFADARCLMRERVRYADGLGLSVKACAAAARGPLELALPLFADAARALELADMKIQASASHWRRGQLTGGDEGAALVAAAENTMRAQGVLVPAGLASMQAPYSPSLA